MSEAETFLQAFHDRQPGATPRALGWGRVEPGGGTTYQHLAAAVAQVRPGLRVLDLACGDGALVPALQARVAAPLDYLGIDIAELDLARARDQHGGPGVEFKRARVQSLPCPDGGIDVVLSHMAFMLFDDIDQVTAEVARVLRPGGVFAALVGGRDPAGPENAWQVFGEVYRRIASAENARTLELGDERTRSHEGLRQILSPARGFAPEVHIDDVELILDGDVEGVWSSLALTYDPSQLTLAGKAALEQDVRGRIARLAGPGGMVPFRMGLCRVVARRA